MIYKHNVYIHVAQGSTYIHILIPHHINDNKFKLFLLPFETLFCYWVCFDYQLYCENMWNKKHVSRKLFHNGTLGLRRKLYNQSQILIYSPCKIEQHPLAGYSRFLYSNFCRHLSYNLRLLNVCKYFLLIKQETILIK